LQTKTGGIAGGFTEKQRGIRKFTSLIFSTFIENYYAVLVLPPIIPKSSSFTKMVIIAKKAFHYLPPFTKNGQD